MSLKFLIIEMIHIVYSTASDLINFYISSKQQLQGVPASFGAKVQKVAVFIIFCELKNEIAFFETIYLSEKFN